MNTSGGLLPPYPPPPPTTSGVLRQVINYVQHFPKGLCFEKFTLKFGTAFGHLGLKGILLVFGD